MKIKKSFVPFFVEYAVKKPIIYFAVVFIGLFVFLFLAFTTQIPVVETHNGIIEYDNGTYSIAVEKSITPNVVSPLYIYIDRNINVYKVSEYQIVEDKIIFSNNFSDVLTIGSKISVDIETNSITLFEQIFLKGGKDQ